MTVRASDGNLDPRHHVIRVKCRTIRDLALEGFTPVGWALEVQALCDRCEDSSAGVRNLSSEGDKTRRRKTSERSRTGQHPLMR